MKHLALLIAAVALMMGIVTPHVIGTDRSDPIILPAVVVVDGPEGPVVTPAEWTLAADTPIRTITEGPDPIPQIIEESDPIGIVISGADWIEIRMGRQSVLTIVDGPDPFGSIIDLPDPISISAGGPRVSVGITDGVDPIPQ